MAQIRRKESRYHSCAAMELLERFVNLYGETPLEGSMIPEGLKLWRDYWIYSGQHMILTDEGWEPGEALESYVDSLDEGEKIGAVIHDEVNWRFGDMKYPRIFPKRMERAAAE